MKKKFNVIVSLFLLASVILYAQDDDKPGLTISGSVDTYWKYDLSGYTDDNGLSNIRTSFADNQNSISIGMLDVARIEVVKLITPESMPAPARPVPRPITSTSIRNAPGFPAKPATITPMKTSILATIPMRIRRM